MRGPDTFTESLFTLRKLEDFVPAGHPLRPIRQMVNAALVKMDALFSGMYEADAKGGRPGIAPEKLLRGMLLQVFYSIRSEPQLMEQTQYNRGHSPGDGARAEEGRPAVCADHDDLQPHAHAHAGENPSTGGVRDRKYEKMGLKSSKTGSMRAEIHSCERTG